MPKKTITRKKQPTRSQQILGPSDRVTMVAAVAIVLIVLVTLHSNSKQGCDYIISGTDFSEISEMSKQHTTPSRTTLSGQAYVSSTSQDSQESERTAPSSHSSYPSSYVPQKHMRPQWKPGCSDGIDNDLDGAIDYGKDKDCSSTQDPTEEITQ